MESFLVAIFGVSIIGSTAYLATKLAFVPALNVFQKQTITTEQTYALYAAGAILGFIIYIPYVALTVAAYVYYDFAKENLVLKKRRCHCLIMCLAQSGT